MRNGLRLLLFFATGPLFKGSCGDSGFAKKVRAFLLGNSSLEKEIREEIPGQLKVAWPNLLDIARENRTGQPLSLKTVSAYVFQRHNDVVMPPCQVKGGVVRKIKKNSILVETPKCKMLEVHFLLVLPKIREGDFVAFHHNWFVAKISARQYQGLV